jgi:class 3 adenylate cyclase/pimeloyl-ACP methyl ester carboxylesterase
MEPQVRYCTTTDGVRIAYTVTGTGSPLLLCAEPTTSHVQLEWSHPALGRYMHGLSRHHTLVRYDHRGFGLSDRVVARDLGEWVLDIEAVAERAGFSEFDLFAVQLAAPAAITFAARHSASITRFMILDGFSRWKEFLSTPQVQAIQGAARLDFKIATEAIGFAAFGEGRDESRDHGAYIRSCVDVEQFIAYETYAAWDASEQASSIRAPTLIMRHLGVEYATAEMSKDLASGIPDAQMMVLNGGWADDVLGVVERVDEFTNVVKQASSPSPLPSGTTIILFTDIVDSTVLTERLGDAAFREKARRLDSALRTIIRDNSGTPIEGKLLGDGVLATFSSASQAIRAALACGKAGEDGGLPLHLGLHAGDVIREDNNVFGGAVNVASRISGLSAPEEVLVSQTVRDLARTSAGVSFEDRGEQELKGVGEAVRVWRVVSST